MCHHSPNRGNSNPFAGELSGGWRYDGTMGDAGQAILVVNFKDGNGLAGVPVGGALWIKSKDTSVRKDASYTGEVLRTLQPGDEVKWLGRDRSTGLDRVEVNLAGGGKCKGYVHRSNLTPTAPSSKTDYGDGKPIDAHALSSSGAATKS